MRIADFPQVSELICRRAWLQERLAELKRGDFALSVGGIRIEGVHTIAIRHGLVEMLRIDIERNARLLGELGVKLDPADDDSGLPTVKVEAAHGIAASI